MSDIIEAGIVYLLIAMLPVGIAVIRHIPWPGWLALWSLTTTASGIGWLGAIIYACASSPLDEDWEIDG